jgi:hypothetical protein
LRPECGAWILWRASRISLDQPPISRVFAPQFCHDSRMRWSLLDQDDTADLPPPPFRPVPVGCDPVGPARGIIGALGISAVFWLALGLVLPLVW